MRTLVPKAAIRLATALLAASLAACAAAPKRDLDAERIGAELQRLQADDSIGPLVPAELARARDALETLRSSPSRKEAERAHLAYLAERRVDIAYATAQAINDERRLVELDRERDRMMLEASRRDAEAARLEAEKLRLQSLARAEEAERAREETAAALALRDMSAQEADAARRQAEQAKRLAEAQATEASLAKREAELAMAAAESLRVQMQNLTAETDRRGQVMTLGDAVFAPGQSTLLPEALANLDPVVDFVQKDAARRIRIEGHTDSRGGDNLNQVLSQRRADAVRDALVSRGVDAARITAIGLGESVPTATNDTPEGRARNRRVEVIVQGAQ